MKSRYGNHMATGESVGAEPFTAEMAALLVQDQAGWVESWQRPSPVVHTLAKLIAMVLMNRVNREYGSGGRRKPDEFLLGLSTLAGQMATSAVRLIDSELATYFNEKTGDCFVKAMTTQGRELTKTGHEPTRFITDIPEGCAHRSDLPERGSRH